MIPIIICIVSYTAILFKIVGEIIEYGYHLTVHNYEDYDTATPVSNKRSMADVKQHNVFKTQQNEPRKINNTQVRELW